MEIRPFRPADGEALAHLHAGARGLPQRVAAGAEAWVASEGNVLVGYASVAPVPGLPGVADLEGFVTRVWRREGVGSALLQHVMQAVAGTEIGQLSHAVSSLESGATHFLRGHGFYLEHEEWQLERGDLARLPPLALPEGCGIRTFARQEAIARFRALYEESFGGMLWYQPYADAEVAGELARASDLLFFVTEGKPVGFAWTRLERGEIGVIEPFGVARVFQGYGYGRALLRGALHQLTRRGATRVHLGLWRRNQVALALYRSEGFRHKGTYYYLARDV